MGTLELHPPLRISSRLLPAVRVGDATISLDPFSWTIYIDGPGWEYVNATFRPPACRIRGETDSDVVRKGLVAVLSFLGACAESRQYAARTGREGENSGLFPEYVGEWSEQHSDSIAVLAFDIENPEAAEEG